MRLVLSTQPILSIHDINGFEGVSIILFIQLIAPRVALILNV